METNSQQESLARAVGRVEGLLGALERRVERLEDREKPPMAGDIDERYKETLKKWREQREAQIQAELGKRMERGIGNGGDEVTEEDAAEAERSWMNE